MLGWEFKRPQNSFFETKNENERRFLESDVFRVIRNVTSYYFVMKRTSQLAIYCSYVQSFSHCHYIRILFVQTKSILFRLLLAYPIKSIKQWPVQVRVHQSPLQRLFSQEVHQIRARFQFLLPSLVVHVFILVVALRVLPWCKRQFHHFQQWMRGECNPSRHRQRPMLASATATDSIEMLMLRKKNQIQVKATVIFRLWMWKR